MYKYIIPICDIQAGRVWDEPVIARSMSECEEKLIKILTDKYDYLDDCLTYREFVAHADENDILIGKITDIEEF